MTNDPAISAITPALDLEPIKARETAAAFGPWKRIKSVGDTYEVATPRGVAVAGDVGLHMCDAEFIAHARTDIPALIAEVERLRAALLSSDRAVPPEAAEIHRDCHDVVCNGDRNQPRGAHGVSCSCQSRYQRMLEELIALKRSAEASDRAVPPECDCDGGEQGDGLCAVPHDPTCATRR